MAVDFSAKIMNLRNQPIREAVVGEDGRSVIGDEMTIGSAATNALNLDYRDETGVNGNDKLKRFKLSLKVSDAKEPIELTAEERDLIKRLVAKAYNPVVCGRVWMAIDPDEAK